MASSRLSVSSAAKSGSARRLCCLPDTRNVDKRRHLTRYSRNPASNVDQSLLGKQQAIPCVRRYRGGQAFTPVGGQSSTPAHSSAATTVIPATSRIRFSLARSWTSGLKFRKRPVTAWLLTTASSCSGFDQPRPFEARQLFRMGDGRGINNANWPLTPGRCDNAR